MNRASGDSSIHMLKLVISHNQSTHGRNLETMNDIVLHDWKFATNIDNPSALGSGVGYVSVKKLLCVPFVDHGLHTLLQIFIRFESAHVQVLS